MNIRNVLRTYSLLRSLTDDESALLETLRTLTDSERELVVESLSPVKVAAKPDERTCRYELSDGSHCGKSSKHLIHLDDSSHALAHKFVLRRKSPRASSLAAQIKSTGKSHLGEEPVCAICSHTEDYEDHAQTSPHYHPFQPPVHSVAKQSSTNGGASGSTPSIEDETANAQDVQCVSGGN